jgi:uncharacterized protein (DUF4415 family)
MTESERVTRAQSSGMMRDNDGWLVHGKTGALISPDPEMERELAGTELERAWKFDGDRLIKRGAGKNPRGRPPKAPEHRKQSTTMRLSKEVIEYYKAGGSGWQTRINEALQGIVMRAGRMPAAAMHAAKSATRAARATRKPSRSRPTSRSSQRPRPVSRPPRQPR